MPVRKLLDPAANKDDLKQELDDWEVKLAREVIAVGLQKAVALGDQKTDTPPDEANFVDVETNVDAEKLNRFQVELVPQAAWADQDEWKLFVSPFLDNAVLVDRSVVLLGKDEVQIAVFRPIDVQAVVQPAGKELLGGPGWTWKAFVDGDDIVIPGAKTTSFGGPSDHDDNGNTASQCSTKDNPDKQGCALPLDGYAKSPAEHAALDGTPLPHMPLGFDRNCQQVPGGTLVQVTDPVSGTSITVPVIDIGPAKRTGHPLDLTVAAARNFKSTATANNFGMKLDCRIIGGAKFIP